jgi:hypothetical protein
MTFRPSTSYSFASFRKAGISPRKAFLDGLALLVVGKGIDPALRYDHAAQLVVGAGHSFPRARASRSTCSTRAL